MRQKENDMLRQTRLELAKMKETQRSQVRELSKRNDEAIRQNRMNEIAANKSKAYEMRKEH